MSSLRDMLKDREFLITEVQLSLGTCANLFNDDRYINLINPGYHANMDEWVQTYCGRRAREFAELLVDDLILNESIILDVVRL